MRVRYSTKHTISLALLTLLLCSLFLPLRTVLASPDSETLRPNAVGNSAELHPVPFGTPNWDCVDEAVENDSDYVSTDTNDQLPEIDRHNIVNTTIGATDTIYNVTVSIKVKSSSNTYKAYFYTAITTESTNYIGSVVNPTTTYTTYSTTYTVNPKTGANWTVQELDDLQIGVGGYSGKRALGGVIYVGFCTQVWCDIFFIPASGKAWHDVSTWTASLAARTWSSGTSFTFSLLTRTWSNGASWTYNLQTRIWMDATTWTYNLVTMAWQNITWIFYLGTSIWTDIATWATNLSAMLWNDVAAWVFSPLTMMWRDLSWLFYLSPPQWVNVAVWIFSLELTTIDLISLAISVLALVFSIYPLIDGEEKALPAIGLVMAIAGCALAVLGLWYALPIAALSFIISVAALATRKEWV